MSADTFKGKRREETEREEEKEKLDKCKERDELAKKKTEEKASKAYSKSKNRAKCKPVKDQERHSTSQDTNAIPVAGSETDETTQDALELDYKCYECLGTYQEDVSKGNGAEWIKGGCGQWLHEECVY